MKLIVRHNVQITGWILKVMGGYRYTNAAFFGLGFSEAEVVIPGEDVGF